MGTIILFNGNIFRWFNVALGILCIVVLCRSCLFSFLPGMFGGFNAMMYAGGVCFGAPLPVPACWLAPFISITHVGLPYWVLRSCYWLWKADVCIFPSVRKVAWPSGVSPCSVPRASPAQTLERELSRHGDILPVGLGSGAAALAGLLGSMGCTLVCSGQALLINEWMTGKWKDIWVRMCSVPPAKGVRQQSTEENPTFLAFIFSPTHHKSSSCDEHCVCLCQNRAEEN